MPVIPEYNADPAAVPFLRWVRENIQSLLTDASLRAEGEKNTNRGQNATITTLGQSIVDLGGRLTAAIAGITLDASAIITGVFPINRIPSIPQTQVTGTWDKAVSTASTVSASSVTASAGVAGASGTFSTSVSSVGAYSNDVTLLGGARVATWQHNSGVFGYAPSTITKKTDLTKLDFDSTHFLAVAPFLYHYRGQVDIRDNPENFNYDPDYHVPWEIGFMAEHLVKAGLGIFVVYDEEGAPKTINYDLFGAVAAIVVGRDHEKRIAALEARLAA